MKELLSKEAIAFLKKDGKQRPASCVQSVPQSKLECSHYFKELMLEGNNTRGSLI